MLLLLSTNPVKRPEIICLPASRCVHSPGPSELLGVTQPHSTPTKRFNNSLASKVNISSCVHDDEATCHSVKRCVVFLLVWCLMELSGGHRLLLRSTQCWSSPRICRQLNYIKSESLKVFLSHQSCSISQQ